VLSLLLLVERIHVRAATHDGAFTVRELALSAYRYSTFGTQVKARHLDDMQLGRILIIPSAFFQCFAQLRNALLFTSMLQLLLAFTANQQELAFPWSPIGPDPLAVSGTVA
jgi:hypothetical protein